MNMIAFQHSFFIKPKENFKKEFLEKNPAPIYFKQFQIEVLPRKAELRICALGMGYAYVNQKQVGCDLFAAPPSNYHKRLWYMQYDITSLLNKGNNNIAILCGNGFLNEDMKNAWNSTDASWRDFPKVMAEIIVDNEVYLSTDETWDYTLESPYLMNRYRQGVLYDSRISAPDSNSFNRIDWKKAQKDDFAPQGTLTLYNSEPIRELKVLEPISIEKKNDTTYIIDFGINMSGYIRLFAEGNSGDKIKIRYAETLTETGELYTESIMQRVYFPEGEFATEWFICNGFPFEWSTKFSYYGFRYAEVSCENIQAIKKALGVFVAQDIKNRSGFECSDLFLNKLFSCGIQATKSNLFYMPTDCPTREKYGWMNDAQSSSEQILTNFHAENMFMQWNVNICDAFTDEKGLPGIVPTHGWGYDWGNGPVSDGSLFEHVYRVYLHSGDKSGLIYNLPYFKRYFTFLKNKEDENGFVNFGLHDWANPNKNAKTTPREFINAILRIKFNRIAALAAKLAGESEEEFLMEEKRQISIIKKNWILPDGSCSIKEQTALAMLIYYGLYDDLEPLKHQLKECIETADYHHNCGMVGLRYLYMALNACGLQEDAMRIITAKGYPSYCEWIQRGATTLWEMWDCALSRNHHMYSDVLSWMMKTIVGISPNDNAATFDKMKIKPYFFKMLNFARGYYDAPYGRVFVEWERVGKTIQLKITSPCNNYLYYDDTPLAKGVTEFVFDA